MEEKNRFSDASRLSESIPSLFFSRIWHVCALETWRASLCCVHCLTVCASTCRVLLYICFHLYDFIIIFIHRLECRTDVRISCTDRLSRVLCVSSSWSSDKKKWIARWALLGDSPRFRHILFVTSKWQSWQSLSHLLTRAFRNSFQVLSKYETSLYIY